MGDKDDKPKKEYKKRISLAPLEFEEALKALLDSSPEDGDEKQSKSKKKSQKRKEDQEPASPDA